MKHIPVIFLFVSMVCMQVSCKLQKHRDGHIRHIAAVIQTSGESQTVVAAVVEYSVAIRNSMLSTSDFSVEGRTISRVYANEVPEMSVTGGTDGIYVIIELSPDDANASAYIREDLPSGGENVHLVVTQLAPVETVTKPYAPATGPITSEGHIHVLTEYLR